MIIYPRSKLSICRLSLSSFYPYWFLRTRSPFWQVLSYEFIANFFSLLIPIFFRICKWMNLKHLPCPVNFSLESYFQNSSLYLLFQIHIYTKLNLDTALWVSYTNHWNLLWGQKGLEIEYRRWGACLIGAQWRFKPQHPIWYHESWEEWYLSTEQILSLEHCWIWPPKNQL